MSLGYDWDLSQVHTIPFVLVDSTGVEVPSLGSSFTLELMKAGGTFQASQGTKAEASGGWYTYTNVASEADTPGAVAIKITGTGIVQQNLIAVVRDLRANGVAFTYTVTSSVDSSPIAGVEIQFSTDSAGANIVWTGETDAFGVARDSNDNLPRLDPGTYYVWRQKPGYSFNDPDIEVVS